MNCHPEICVNDTDVLNYIDTFIMQIFYCAKFKSKFRYLKKQTALLILFLVIQPNENCNKKLLLGKASNSPTVSELQDYKCIAQLNWLPALAFPEKVAVVTVSPNCDINLFF